MFPGQSGKIVATFMSKRTSAAAERLRSMSNARITDHTASELEHPADDLEHHSAEGSGRRAHDREPLSRHRDEPTHRGAAGASRRRLTRGRRRAPANATANSAHADDERMRRGSVTAQCGIFAVSRT